MLRKLIIGTVVIGAIAVPCIAKAAATATAIVIQDQASLRAAPRDSAQQQALLWKGEALEVRGERLDYLQVWDYRRERGGFVHASQVRRTSLTAADAPELMSIVRFVRDTAGSESLGIGLIAAYLQAAPAEVLNGEAGIEALDALGTLADRLAGRASSGAAQPKPVQTRLAAHLEVAGRYGVKFISYERDGRMQICYDGDAFKRVLAMRAKPEQKARAALGLTRTECVDPSLNPAQLRQKDEQRAAALDRVDVAALPAYLKNRVYVRRTAVWSSIAFERARSAQTSPEAVSSDSVRAAANRALSEFAGINKTELTDEDVVAYNEAAMRANASRWAAIPAAAMPDRRPMLVTSAGQPGETCLTLVDDKHFATNPLAKRCTYGVVWTASATLNREGNAMAVAVQQTDTWREMWLLRRNSQGWSIEIVPPATTTPDVGYAEFAGWVPGGKQMLVAREAKSEGKYVRRFELVRLNDLATERQANDPSILGAFQRWQDVSWKRNTTSIR